MATACFHLFIISNKQMYRWGVVRLWERTQHLEAGGKHRSYPQVSVEGHFTSHLCSWFPSTDFKLSGNGSFAGYVLPAAAIWPPGVSMDHLSVDEQDWPQGTGAYSNIQSPTYHHLHLWILPAAFLAGPYIRDLIQIHEKGRIH